MLEGPLAGGHLGFRFDEISLESNKLENLLPPVKETAAKYGDFPVIVAGGIYSHDDIIAFFAPRGRRRPVGYPFSCDGGEQCVRVVQTSRGRCGEGRHHRFAKAGLSVRHAFQALEARPHVRELHRKGERPPRCDKGYLLSKDGQRSCPADSENGEYFCVCNGLLSSAGYNPQEEEALYTVGVNGYRVDKVLSVKELMDELTGLTASLPRNVPRNLLDIGSAL